MYSDTIIAPVGAFFIVMLGTFTVFKFLGLRSGNFLFTRSEAIEFQKRYAKRAGPILVVANIFGTLTSLASVYVFMIGTAKVFGYFIFISPISIALSFISTNWLTRGVLRNNPSFRTLIEKSETASGIIARMVWSNSLNGKITSALIKYLSLINIVSVLWLEFSVAADLFALQSNLPGNSVVIGATATGVIAFSIILLVLRYGLRGYVFADIFQAPLVIVGTLSVLGALIWVIIHHPSLSSLPSVLAPRIPLWQGLLFTIQVAAANAFFVLMSEGHWVRTWLFHRQETVRQGLSTIGTAIVWAVLALAGCLAGLITPLIGTSGVIPVIKLLVTIHPAAALLFWLGGSAALCSVADAQIYWLILVFGFRVKDGKISDALTRPQRPLPWACIAGVGFGLMYAAVRYWTLPFEKIVFILLPLSLNALPAFMAVATNRPVWPLWTIVSALAYLGASIEGLLQPANNFSWTLAAALMPIFTSFVVLIIQRQKAATNSVE